MSSRMNELIRVRKSDGGKDIVSARELYSFLEITTDFTTWCKRMFEYGFIEGTDYVFIKSGEPELQLFNNPNPKMDAALTLDCAKEISMLQRTDKGKEARLYFIACEKALIEKSKLSLPSNYLDALKALVISEEQKALQQEKIKELEPKAEVYDKISDSTGLKSISQIAKILGTGEILFFAWLRKELILISNKHEWNLPYQQYIKCGYFEVKTSHIEVVNRSTSTTYVTPKGELWIAKLWKIKHQIQ
jgi:anti-repressor protein